MDVGAGGGVNSLFLGSTEFSSKEQDACDNGYNLRSSLALAGHWCRFVDFKPAAVTAVAFPPQVQKEDRKERAKMIHDLGDGMPLLPLAQPTGI